MSDQCQNFDNLINLVKNLNSEYIKYGTNAALYKINSLNKHFDQRQKDIFENQKRESERIFRHLRKQIQEIYEELGIFINFYCSEQEMLMLEEKDKCFQQMGHGIQFYYYDQSIHVNLYTIKDGEKEKNELYSYLEKRLQPQYFLDQVNEYINLSELFLKIKKFYFNGLEKMQKQFIPCLQCRQILKYCGNSFVPPSLFYVNKITKFIHQSCLRESRKQQKKSYDL